MSSLSFLVTGAESSGDMAGSVLRDGGGSRKSRAGGLQFNDS